MTPGPSPTPIPATTRRWFFGYDAERLDPTSPFVVSRLLEEGGGDDLRWLTAQADEGTLRQATENPRSELSLRSRTFWQVLLDIQPTANRSTLWPLDR